MRFFFIYCLIFWEGILFAQSSLSGNVYFLNSKKKPAIGVQIIAEDSNNDYSKSDGSYQLHFPNKKAGDRIVLSTSATDGEGNQIVLANKKVVGQCRIPSSASDRFEIVVADSLTFVKNSKIYVQSLLKMKKAELRKLRQLLEEQNQSGQQTELEKNLLVNKLVKLEKDLGLAHKELKEKAAYLALFNLDNAPDFTEKTLRALRGAKDIDEVLKAIDQDKLYKLDKNFRTKIRLHKDSIPHYEQQLGFLYEAYDLRKELLLSVNRFSEAVQCLEAQIKLEEYKLIDSMQLAINYDETAELLLKIGRYKESKGYAMKLERFCRKNNNLRGFAYAARKNINEIDYLLSDKREEDFYLNLLDSTLIKELEYSIQNSTDQGPYQVDQNNKLDSLGVDVFKEIISFIKNIDDSENPEKESCEFISYLLSNPITEVLTRDSYYVYIKYAVCEEMAFDQIAEGLNNYINTLNKDDQKSLKLKCDSYAFLANIYAELEEDELMMDAREKAILTREKFSNEDDVDELVSLYVGYGNELAYTLLIDSSFYANKSFAYFEKALELQKSQLSPFHFYIADTYHAYASFCHQLDDYTKAETLLYNAIDIKMTHLEKDAYEFYYDYSLMSYIYNDMKDSVQYIDYLEKTIDLNIKYKTLYDPSLLSLYWNQLDYYKESAEYTKALLVISELEKAISHHKNLGTIYNPNSLEKYLIDCLRNKVILYARSGDLEKATEHWMEYKSDKQIRGYNDKYIELHLSILEANEAKILSLIKDNYLYLDYVFPESMTLLNKLEKKGLIKISAEKRITNGY